MEKRKEKEMQFLKLDYYNAFFGPFSPHTPYFIEDHVHH
jgi:hypothetical protein